MKKNAEIRDLRLELSSLIDTREWCGFSTKNHIKKRVCELVQIDGVPMMDDLITILHNGGSTGNIAKHAIRQVIKMIANSQISGKEIIQILVDLRMSFISNHDRKLLFLEFIKTTHPTNDELKIIFEMPIEMPQYEEGQKKEKMPFMDSISDEMRRSMMVACREVLPKDQFREFYSWYIKRVANNNRNNFLRFCAFK